MAEDPNESLDPRIALLLEFQCLELEEVPFHLEKRELEAKLEPVLLKLAALSRKKLAISEKLQASGQLPYAITPTINRDS